VTDGSNQFPDYQEGISSTYAHSFSPYKIPQLRLNGGDASYNTQDVSCDFKHTFTPMLKHCYFQDSSRKAFHLSPIIEDCDTMKPQRSSSPCSTCSVSFYSEEDLHMHLIDRASGVFIEKVRKVNIKPYGFVR
jgi:hypothetical protein